MTYVAVPALPRAACVEVQPLSCTMLPGARSDDSEGSDCEHDSGVDLEASELQGRPVGVSGVAATRLPGWLRNLREISCKMPALPGLTCRMLAAPHKFGICHVSLLQSSMPPDVSAVGVGEACKAVSQAIGSCLHAAGFSRTSVLSMRCYHKVNGPMADLEPIFRHAWEQAGEKASACAVCCIPVLAIGPDTSVDACLHIEVTATTDTLP